MRRVVKRLAKPINPRSDEPFADTDSPDQGFYIDNRQSRVDNKRSTIHVLIEAFIAEVPGVCAFSACKPKSLWSLAFFWLSRG